MGKNYYEILEVDKNASQEIIKKAYSTLAKRYHPDLQPPEKKIKAEERFKLINEAYEILSNNELRSQYNNQLIDNYVPKDLYNSIYEENIQLKKIINEINDAPINQSNNYKSNTSYDDFKNYQRQSINNTYNQTYNQVNNNEYYDSYSNKKNILDYLKNIFSIIFTIIIVILIWNTPIVKNIINLFFNIH